MERRFQRHISQALSGLFHPLLMPMYGISALSLSIYESGYAERYLMSYALSPALKLTRLWGFAIPVGIILLLRIFRQFSSLEMEDRGERNGPYLACSLCYIVWNVQLYKAQVPIEWLLIAMGGTLALMMVAAVNLRWKISAHATGVGGMVGSVLAYGLGTGSFSWIVFLTVSAIAIAVMCARLCLHRHTVMQVTAGWSVGLLCTLLPTYLFTLTALPNV